MNIFRHLRRCILPIMFLLSAFSVLMLLLGRPSPQIIWQLMLFPAAYTAFAVMLIAVPGRWRIPLFAACCAASIAAGFMLFAGESRLLFMPVIGAAALFFSLSFADRLPEETPPFFYVATLLTQFGVLFLMHFSKDQTSADDPLYALLMAFFILYLLLLLLTFSRISLNNATLSRYRLPGVISRVCTTMTIGFFLLALALSSLPAVISGVYFAARMLRSTFEQFLLFLINLFPSESIGGFQGGGMPMLPGSSDFIEQEPSMLSIILEKAAEVLTVLVLIVGSILLVRLIAQLLLRLVRYLLERLQHYAAAVTEDYKDEISDTRQEDADRSFHLLGRRTRRSKTAYPDTPAGRIRRSYARLMLSHSQWKFGSTARENLPDTAAALYERARYSAHPVTQPDADRFDQETRRL